MTELDELERQIRADAERKITAGRDLAAKVTAVLTTHEEYRGSFREAIAAGFTEAELARLGMVVDGVKTAAGTRPRRTPARRGARGDAGSAAVSETAGAPADDGPSDVQPI